jgi:predicted component of type VI protein secretion system
MAKMKEQLIMSMFGVNMNMPENGSAFNDKQELSTAQLQKLIEIKNALHAIDSSEMALTKVQVLFLDLKTLLAEYPQNENVTLTLAELRSLRENQYLAADNKLIPLAQKLVAIKHFKHKLKQVISKLISSTRAGS